VPPTREHSELPKQAGTTEGQDRATEAPEMMLIDNGPHMLVAKTVFVTHVGAEIITEPISYAHIYVEGS
jgi:hypothetical protein